MRELDTCLFVFLSFRTIEDGHDNEQIAEEADHGRNDSVLCVKDRRVEMRIGASASAHEDKSDQNREDGTPEDDEINPGEGKQRFVMHTINKMCRKESIQISLVSTHAQMFIDREESADHRQCDPDERYSN